MIVRRYEQLLLDLDALVYLPLALDLRESSAYDYVTAPTLKGAPTFVGPGVLRGVPDRSLLLDGVDDGVDTGHATRANYCPNPLGSEGIPMAGTGNYAAAELVPGGTDGIPSFLEDAPIAKYTYDGLVGTGSNWARAVEVPVAGRYTFACPVWIPASYDGGNLRTDTANFTGEANIVGGNADLSKRDQWQIMATSLDIAPGDLIGTLSVRRQNTALVPSSIPTGYLYVGCPIMVEKTNALVHPLFPKPSEIDNHHAVYTLETANRARTDLGVLARNGRRTFALIANVKNGTTAGLFGSSLRTRLTVQIDGDVQWRPNTGEGNEIEWAEDYSSHWDKPTFVVFAFDDANDVAELFLDGVSQGVRAVPETYAQVDIGEATVTVGKAGTTNFTNGTVSHFAAIPDRLGVEEVAELYAAISEEWRHPETGDIVPRWPSVPLRVYTPKAGLPAGLDGSAGIPPLGEFIDLGEIVAAGSLKTSNPDVQGILRQTGLFDEAPA